MAVQKAILRIGKLNKNKKDGVEYYEMPVQYNPASLSFSSRAGLIEEEGPGEAGLGSRMSAIIPPETTLAFELLFEDVDVNEAFLSDTKQQSMEALGKRRSKATGQGQKRKQGEGFVKRQIEGLLSLVMQVSTKQVVFLWGDMSFSGELEDVSAEYTMFSPNGTPVCGKVNLTIRQSKADSDDSANKSEEIYWKNAWKNFTKQADKREEKETLKKQYEKAGELLKLDI